MTDAEDAKREKGSLPRAVDAAIARVRRWRVARVWLRYAETHGPALADGITYRALFSVFAAVLLGFSIAGLWLAGNPRAFAALISTVNATIPGLVGQGGIVDPETIRAPVGFSIAGIASLAGLVGAALGAIGSLRIALRTLAGSLADDVLWVWVILRNLGLAAGIGVAFALMAAATVATGLGVDAIASFLGAQHSSATAWIQRILTIVIVYTLDLALVAGLFAVLSGVRAPAKALWGGAALGAVGLLVLQQLSSLFVGGARANPLLASFGALIALLLWMNLSAQVLLLAGTWIIVRVEDDADCAQSRQSPQRPVPEHHPRDHRAEATSRHSSRAAGASGPR